jgi:hypothetical protein
MNQLEYRLKTLLNEQENAISKDLLSIASELLSQVSELKIKLTDTETQIEHLIEKLNAELGVAIRQRHPRLTVLHRNGECACGYRSKDLICRPDLQRKTWVINGRLGHGFGRQHPNLLQLSSDVNPLADAIVDYFKHQYITL